MLPFSTEQNTPFIIRKTVGSKNVYDSAFEKGNLKISLLAPRIYCLNDCYLQLEHDFSDITETFKMHFEGIENGCDVYSCRISCDVGLYYFHFSVKCNGKSYSVASCGDEKSGYITSEYPAKFQIMFYKNVYTPVEWFSDGAMYHIFVDRFFKTENKLPIRNDAVYINDWYNGEVEFAEYPGQPLKNNTFFGGSLYGVCKKLDYLVQMGIKTIYLSPIFKAYSNHKYDTGDYMKIDDMFGGEKAFSLLVKEAHRRNMKIILDGVFNHVGDDSLYFNKYGKYPENGAYSGKESQYYDWFDFHEFPNRYRCWWGIDIMPSLNHTKPELREYLCGENGVIRHWLRKGADGWRLDVADELPEDLLYDIKKACEAEKPGSLLLGEVWEDASNKIAYSYRRHYFQGKALDGVMNYPLRNAIISFVKYGDASAMQYALTLLTRHYPHYSLLNAMNFLGTHDTERILTVLGGEECGGASGSELSKKQMSEYELSIGKARLKLAFALLVCCPGVPCIYYGDEAGMQGYRDPFNRRPYPWGREDEDLREYFKNTLKIRNKAAFKKGKTEVISAQNGVLIFRRYYKSSKVICIFNGHNNEKTVYINDKKIVIGAMSHKIIEE